MLCTMAPLERAVFTVGSTVCYQSSVKGMMTTEGDGVQSYTGIRECSLPKEIPLVSVCVQGGVGTVATVRDAVINGTASLLVQVFNVSFVRFERTNRS